MTSPRHQPSSVLRYISVFRQVMEADRPVKIVFSPETIGVSVTTAEARIRDAAFALIKGLVTHPDFPPDRVKDFEWRWKLYKVHSNDKVVIISPKKVDKEVKEGIAVLEREDAIAVIDGKDTVALIAFGVLLSKRLLVGKVKIQGKLDERTKLELNKFDIALIPEPDGSYTLI